MTIIAHHHAHSTAARGHVHSATSSPRVFGDVHEQLPGRVEEHNPYLVGDRLRLPVVRKLSDYAVLLLSTVSEPFECGPEPQLVKDRRADLGGEGTRVRHRVFDQVVNFR